MNINHIKMQESASFSNKEFNSVFDIRFDLVCTHAAEVIKKFILAWLLISIKTV